MDDRVAATFREVMQAEPTEGIAVEETARLAVWKRPGLGRRERRLVTVTCAGYTIKSAADRRPLLRGPQER